MGEKFQTERGTVEAVRTATDQWGVFIPGGGGFLGAVELEGGGFTALPVGRSSKSLSSLSDAVKYIGRD